MLEVCSWLNNSECPNPTLVPLSLQCIFCKLPFDCITPTDLQNVSLKWHEKKNAIHSKVKARKKITFCKLLTLSHSINFPAVSLDVPWMKRSSLWTLIWMTTTSAASASWRQIQGPYLSATSALISALKVEPLLFFVCFCFLNQMLTRWTDTS